MYQTAATPEPGTAQFRSHYAERLVMNMLTERGKMTSVCVCVRALADTVPNAAACFPHSMTKICYISDGAMLCAF